MNQIRNITCLWNNSMIRKIKIMDYMQIKWTKYNGQNKNPHIKK